MPNEKYAEFRNFSSGDTPFEERKKIWLEISDMTEEEFDSMMNREKSREPNVPQVGQQAPDFTAERLDRHRKRTGEYVTLRN